MTNHQTGMVSVRRPTFKFWGPTNLCNGGKLYYRHSVWQVGATWGQLKLLGPWPLCAP